MDKRIHAARLKVVRRALLITFFFVALGTGVMIGWAYMTRYNDASEQAVSAPIRELIVQAAEDAKADAPVEAKTGDVYFPQAKLYLPAASSYLRLTYAYDDGVLSVGNKTALRQGISALYNARNIRDMFERVPYLQACQRGVTVLYEPSDAADKELRQTVTLNNGKTAYLYIEKMCPELGETADLLKDLRAY